jgi:hypothetical protein
MYEGQRSEQSSISPSYKSWGEEQIARLLQREKIRYRYEYPLAVIDRGKVRIWYPDFQLVGYGMIIEYFGLNGNLQYNERTRHKQEVYKANGIEGLFLNEKSLKGNWPQYIVGQIEGVLKDRLNRFYHGQDRNNVAAGNYQGTYSQGRMYGKTSNVDRAYG